MQYQQTLKNKIEITGTEPFGGKQVKVQIEPAPEDTGRIFRTSGIDIPATLEYVEPIKGIAKLLSLKKANRRILIPEHLIGELFGYGIDNATIELETMSTLSYQILRYFGSARNTEVVPYFGRKLCDALKNNVKEQDKPKKILRLEDKIETEKITFEPIKGDDLIIKVITDYKLARGESIRQEKEIIVSPESVKEILSARAYCNVPTWAPKWLSRTLRYLFSLSYGFSYGNDESNLFYPQKTKEKWKAQELMENEVACHSILDRIGEISLLPGRLAGVKITSRFAGHKEAIETLKNLNKFYVG